MVVVPLSYFTAPTGDRWFAMGVMAVFAVIVSITVYLLPVLRCPSCGRATDYFDNYTEQTERLTGGNRRHVICRNCHTTIDRLNGSALMQIAPEDGRILRHIIFLVFTRIFLLFVGWPLLLGGAWSLIVIVWPEFQRIPHNPRFIAISVCCGLTLFAGIGCLATSWWLKRRLQGFAASQGIRLERGIRIRW